MEEGTTLTEEVQWMNEKQEVENHQTNSTVVIIADKIQL